MKIDKRINKLVYYLRCGKMVCLTLNTLSGFLVEYIKKKLFNLKRQIWILYIFYMHTYYKRTNNIQIKKLHFFL